MWLFLREDGQEDLAEKATTLKQRLHQVYKAWDEKKVGSLRNGMVGADEAEK